MRYPAEVTWFDREPEGGEDHTARWIVLAPDELESALDRFEQDMRRLGFALAGEIFDREGHCLTFGFSAFEELGFVAFQPGHLLNNERGHYQYAPLKWSVSNPADAATLPAIGNLRGRDRIDFMIWPGYDPYEVSPEYCVPIPLVKQAILEYSTMGEFSRCIAWGERADWTKPGP